MSTKVDQCKLPTESVFVEFVYCHVLFPHVREIYGQTMMLEPLLSGDVALPNDDDTKKCVERGWLKVVSEPFMAEPASKNDLGRL